MKITHNDRKSETTQPKPRFNTVIAGMIAGLALLPGCAGSLPRENPAEMRAAPAAESQPQETDGGVCIRQGPTNDYLSVSRMLGTCQVAEGDVLLRLDWRSENPGFLSILVDGIDEQGVDIDLRMEVAATKNSGMPALWHVDYGETRTIGSRVDGPLAANDLFQLPDFLVVRASEGRTPDTAILEISKPVTDSP